MLTFDEMIVRRRVHIHESDMALLGKVNFSEQSRGGVPVTSRLLLGAELLLQFTVIPLLSLHFTSTNRLQKIPCSPIRTKNAAKQSALRSLGKHCNFLAM